MRGERLKEQEQTGVDTEMMSPIGISTVWYYGHPLSCLDLSRRA